MPEWINNPHTDYVFAAYAIAFIALVGLAVVSLYEKKRASKEWDKLSKTRADDNQ